jgi:hypothetical protein
LCVAQRRLLSCQGRDNSSAQEKETMINKSKLVLIAGVALVSVATPALAQSAWTTGTVSSRARAGYSVPYSSLYGGQSSGLSAYDMVPGPYGAGRYSPSANGGGSTGYNWSVENDN